MSKKNRDLLRKTRHSSLDMPDAEVKEKKKQDNMLSKAKNKLYNLSDVLKPRFDGGDMKKSLTQSTIDYFFKSCPNNNNITRDKQNNHVFYSNDISSGVNASNNNSSNNRNRRASSLQKQHSVGSYPIKMDVISYGGNSGCGDEDIHKIIKIDKDNDDVKEQRSTAALALERPRKKLSFREPEIMGYNIHVNKDNIQKKRVDGRLHDNKRHGMPNGINKINSYDDVCLEVISITLLQNIRALNILS